MDGLKLKSIHKTRCFFNKNMAIDEITNQLQAKPCQWKAWVNRANAFKHIDHSKSYASVVRQGTPSTMVMLNNKPLKLHDNNSERTKVRKLKIFNKPCISADSTPAGSTKITAAVPFSVAKATTTESISLFNHFEMLADRSFHLRANKNGKGQTLGTALVQQGPQLNSMDSFTIFKGNKNKTGQTLGKSMRKQHASLTFRHNKNKNGQILGSMLHTTNGDNMSACKSHTRSQDNTSTGDTASAVILSSNVLTEDIPRQTDTNDSCQSSINQFHTMCLCGTLTLQRQLPYINAKSIYQIVFCLISISPWTIRIVFIKIPKLLGSFLIMTFSHILVRK